MATRDLVRPRRAKISAFAFSLSGAVLASLILVVADASPRQDRAAGLTVHEWGTFTMVAGVDGTTTEWRPLDVSDDLPTFVERQTRNGKSEIFGSVRMETPVIYFYAQQEMKLSVAVDFPAGHITEWYPSALRGIPTSSIAWENIILRPGSEEAFPVEDRESHYFAARKTDATPLVVTNKDGKAEHEKMLFYRGVGSFAMPLKVETTKKTVTLHNSPNGPAYAIVVECHGGDIAFAEVELKNESLTIPRLFATSGGLESLRTVMFNRLVTSGLYPREASAMLATWGDAWVEDGLRVFFVVPRPLTDTLLPLRIQPKPSAIERVLLGRIEIVTPEQEAMVVDLTTQLAGPLEGRPEVRARLGNLGHFTEPILRIVAARHAGGPIDRTLRDEFYEMFRNF